MSDQNETEASACQLLYASVLEKGMYLGLCIMFITFVLYLLGIISPVIPMADLPQYWSLNVTDYLNAVEKDYLHLGHTVTGWSWLTLVGYGDFLNFIGIAILSLVTIVCYIVIIPVLWVDKDKLFTFIAIAEVVVLVLAASGFLEGGH